MMQIVNIYSKSSQFYFGSNLSSHFVFFFWSLNPSTAFTFCQVIAAARQAGGLALERQVWDALPCRESFSSQGTDVLRIDVQPMCCIILYIHVCVTYLLRRTKNSSSSLLIGWCVVKRVSSSDI